MRMQLPDLTLSQPGQLELFKLTPGELVQLDSGHLVGLLKGTYAYQGAVELVQTALMQQQVVALQRIGDILLRIADAKQLPNESRGKRYLQPKRTGTA
jgi:hypothetical protein